MAGAKVLLVAAVCWCTIGQIAPMSFVSKARHRQYMLTRIEHGATDELDIPCEDDYSDCSKYVAYCNKYEIIKNKCSDTCGSCRVPHPENCTESPFGCCWDNFTSATGPSYEGCKPCEDEYAECSYFRGRCHEPGAEKIRLACPVTCNVGCYKKQCLDDKYQAPICKLYKKYGFCEASRDLMGKICAKTCEFC